MEELLVASFDPPFPLNSPWKLSSLPLQITMRFYREGRGGGRAGGGARPGGGDTGRGGRELVGDAGGEGGAGGGGR